MTAMTATPLAAAAIAQLEAEGVDTVIGTVVNPAGLTQAKTVPIRRTNTFANPGLGASPVWHTFCIDQCSIAFTADISVVGDQRLRIDLSALRIIGDGLAWAPAGFFEQDPSETTVDPTQLSDVDRDRAGILRLAADQADAIAVLDSSKLLRCILGDPVVDAVVAVRQLEHERYGDLDPAQLADKFRMAWSV